MLETLLTTVIPALLPAVGDAIRGVIGRFTGGAGAKPQNVDEAIKLMQAQTDRLTAMAQLDKPLGSISKWVADLRASSRYIATLAVIINGIAQAAWGNDPMAVNLSLQLAQSGFFFLFGDRVYLHLKQTN